MSLVLIIIVILIMVMLFSGGKADYRKRKTRRVYDKFYKGCSKRLNDFNRATKKCPVDEHGKIDKTRCRYSVSSTLKLARACPNIYEYAHVRRQNKAASILYRKAIELSETAKKTKVDYEKLQNPQDQLEREEAIARAARDALANYS
jgi:hypothetical protein